jgi:ribonuclease P protein component
MLPPAHRMRQSRDFQVAVRRGRRAGRRTLVVHAALSGDGGEAVRVGFVVSKGVGSAVVRNRVKRRLRAAVAARVGSLPPGWLVVVRANPAAAEADSATLASDLDVALPRVLAAVAPGGPARTGARGRCPESTGGAEARESRQGPGAPGPDGGIE